MVALLQQSNSKLVRRTVKALTSLVCRDKRAAASHEQLAPHISTIAALLSSEDGDVALHACVVLDNAIPKSNPMALAQVGPAFP